MRRFVYISSFASALVLIAAPSAFAQTEGQKLERVERDNADIRHDSRDIRQDKADLRRDARKLKEERAERNADLRKEERAIEHGNLKAAEKFDRRRREEQKDVNAARRNLNRDKRDLAHDKVDRNKDIAKRNRDAGKL